MSINLEQQIKCVRRELALRQNVYPKWVATGKKKKDDADHEIAAMQAVHDTLMAVKDREDATAAARLPTPEPPPPDHDNIRGDRLL